MEQAITQPSAPLVTTDIHTHLTGAPRSDELVRLGLQHDMKYPAAMLRLAGVALPDGIRVTGSDTRMLPGGIAAPARGSPEVRLRDLPCVSLGLLTAAMQVPARPPAGTQGEPFVALERAYSVRRPLAASRLLLADVLRSVAADACRDGVSHIEPSASAPLLDGPDGGHAWLADASAAAAAIRRETGVRSLFLATVNRHSPHAALARSLARLDEAMSAWPLLVGVDIAGHETNPAADFMPLVVSWAASRVRRGLPAVIRIHAGETSCHPANVRAVLEGFRQIGLPPGMGRVGHALHGVGRREVALARETGAIFEMGIGSNRANGYRAASVRSVGGARLTRLIRAGVAAVLGTDGGGIYRTCSAREARHAITDGAPRAILAEVVRCEEVHIQRMAGAFPAAFATPPS